jgi:alpha-1,3-glucan synthase
MHIAFTLVTAQVLGSIATIVARAIAPNNLGPGDVFPDFSYYRPGDSLEVFQKAWFYIGLLSQIAVCFGYFLFFRKVPPAPLKNISDV